MLPLLPVQAKGLQGRLELLPEGCWHLLLLLLLPLVLGG
jgi:hypothetical protein